ncbi:hypothetical protein GMST_42040 [Geomonas silvestris]|uniref:Uncharacterized protein n=1 Tax=Geomonas silvestris TaxID=2740184 RepID=A0A6V8MQJ9_9BACT|nr:hypothetical protein [Geomonas silvestris]GFO61879.1 hypothetical protein GMST_42040 [Geomonas silvestris]
MKDTTTIAPTSTSALSFSLANLPIGCLLVLASLLALAGGIATSVLFFGLLLLFSLLLMSSRQLSVRTVPVPVPPGE